MSTIKNLLGKLNHFMSGCDWVIFYNKNKKAYKRICNHDECCRYELRCNGKWRHEGIANKLQDSI